MPNNFLCDFLWQHRLNYLVQLFIQNHFIILRLFQASASASFNHTQILQLAFQPTALPEDEI